MIFASGDVGCSVTQDVQNSSNTFIVKAIMSVKDSKHVEPLNQYIQNTLDREPCTIQWGLWLKKVVIVFKFPCPPKAVP